jgi:purine-binding chemotaxis protein CheW
MTNELWARAEDREAMDTREMLSLCSLTADGRLFGIDTRRIREVLGAARLHPVPLAPAFVAGVLAYRGEVLTAVSLRALLGLAAGQRKSCVLVLDGDEMEEQFGLLVDEVGGVVMVERGAMAENPSTLDEVSAMLFRGAHRTPEGLLVELERDRLQPARLAASGLFGKVASGKGAVR